VEIKPILFSTEMVRAILEGRKTMTRRVVKPRYDKERGRFARMGLFATIGLRNGMWHGLSPEGIPFVNDEIKQPRYQPGDILWVRETWLEHKGTYIYKADGKHEALDALIGVPCFKWRPSIFMPRAAARTFLRVTAVRAERLHEITEEDAVREGFFAGWHSTETSSRAMAARQAFCWVWDTLNGKRAGGAYAWARNPWVWVVSFERVEMPADWRSA
jgi:hypothetical protein